MRILAVDTSAAPVSAALLCDGKLCGELYLNIKTTHSQTLMPLVDTLLRSTGTSVREIDVFAVNAGPGSFTGVRIGTASVKGMAMPLDKPCAGVSTLEAMAYGLPYRDGLFCAVMDARCSQVYHALFRAKQGRITRLSEDKALGIDALYEELKEYSDTIYLVGDGAELCYQSFSDKLDNIILPPQNIRYQHAYGTALAAEKMAQENKLVSADALMPLYLRLPQAERELKAKLNQQQEGNG